MPVPQVPAEKSPEAATAPNAEKPTLTLKSQAAAEEKEVARLKALSDEQQKEPEVENPFVDIAALASTGRDNLLAQLRAHRETQERETYVPPVPTARQQSQTEREMEAGRNAVARHAAQQASRPIPQKDPTEGTSTPAFRPNSVVPDPIAGRTEFVAGSRQFGSE